MRMKNKKIINIAIIAGAILAVGLILMLIGNRMEANAIKEEQEAEDYLNLLSETCTCLEHDRIYCPDGFELKGALCYNAYEKEYTARILGCSQYDCSGEIKLWNNETETWESKTGGSS